MQLFSFKIMYLGIQKNLSTIFVRMGCNQVQCVENFHQFQSVVIGCATVKDITLNGIQIGQLMELPQAFTVIALLQNSILF